MTSNALSLDCADAPKGATYRLHVSNERSARVTLTSLVGVLVSGPATCVGMQGL